MIEKFSVSDANTFKQCPRKFYYSKVLGYESAVVPKHFVLGNAYDKMLEVYDKLGFEEAFVQIDGIFKNSHDSAEAEVILKIYHEKYKDSRLPPFTIAGREGNQHGFGVALDKVWVTGYIDKVSMGDVGANEGQLIIVERKTTSEPIEAGSAYWDKLDLDPQIRAYVWYASKLHAQTGWVCYEVIRKLSSSYDRKLAKKYDVPIDEYRSLLATLKYDKVLVDRRWFFVDKAMTQEFEEEHLTVWETANTPFLKGKEHEPGSWPKHEGACKDFGGCQFAPICKRERSFESMVENGVLTQEKGRFE